MTLLFRCEVNEQSFIEVSVFGYRFQSKSIVCELRPTLFFNFAVSRSTQDLYKDMAPTQGVGGSLDKRKVGHIVMTFYRPLMKF